MLYPQDFSAFHKKQITGIEPASSAWEADVLPMNYICNTRIIITKTAGIDK